MRIITKLQILCIVLSCVALTSCSEDDGTGIQEVDVTRQKLIGDWSIESLKIGNSTKSGTVNSEDVEFQYTLRNEVGNSGGDYIMTFLENGDLRESGGYSDQAERVFASYNGDRLFESKEKDPADMLIEYSSIFFSAASDTKFGVNADGKSISISSANGNLSMDVTFFGDNRIRVTYPLTDVTPFFGSDTFALPPDDITDPTEMPANPKRIDIAEGNVIVANNVKPVSGTLYVILTK